MDKNTESKFLSDFKPQGESETRKALWSLELTLDALNRAAPQYSRSEVASFVGKFLTSNIDKV